MTLLPLRNSLDPTENILQMRLPGVHLIWSRQFCIEMNCMAYCVRQRAVCRQDAGRQADRLTSVLAGILDVYLGVNISVLDVRSLVGSCAGSAFELMCTVFTMNLSSGTSPKHEKKQQHQWSEFLLSTTTLWNVIDCINIGEMPECILFKKCKLSQIYIDWNKKQWWFNKRI